MASDPRFPNLHLLDHPLIQHKLTLLRDRHTPTQLFRQCLREISLLMGYEVTRDLGLTRRPIETPMAAMLAPSLVGEKPAVVSILRAGLGMSEGLLELMPFAHEGHIGLYRDERTKHPVEYLVRLPDKVDRLFILVDPMVATGHSAVAALDILNRHGIPDSRIRFMALLTAPEGVATFQAAHAGVPLYAAALDDRLDANAYILPGLGDAGDRLAGKE
jgi:uracil phosphoribosyltransferase